MAIVAKFEGGQFLRWLLVGLSWSPEDDGALLNLNVCARVIPSGH
jgi:hypothetical protein